MQKSLREVLSLKGFDLIFEYNGNVIAINTEEFTSEKEEAVYQQFGLKTLRGNEWVTLYNPEVWKVAGGYRLVLVEDCLVPEQPFFTVAPILRLEGVKDLSHWDVASATDLSSMFSGCKSLKELILDGWNVLSVTDLHSMFYGCKSLETLSLGGWGVSRVEDMSAMFYGCKSLGKLSLDGWNVLRVKDMEWLFYGCKSLAKLSLDGWCISEDAKTDCMFDNCPAGISVESLKERTTPCSVF